MTGRNARATLFYNTMKLAAKDKRVEMGPDGLPVAFQIFAPGANPTIKGTFTFDASSQKSTMARFRDMGNPVGIDYEHQTASDPPVEAPAAGRFALELRNGALWATDVKWTPRAAEQLKGQEYFSFSPWFEHDESGRIVALNNVALTNFPGTKHQPLLIAAKAVPYSGGKIVEGSWDGAAAEQRMREWATTGDAIDFGKYARGFAWFDDANPEAIGSYKLPHHDVQGGELVVHRGGVIAAGNVLSGARGGADIPAAELPAVRAHLAQHYSALGMAPPWEAQQTQGSGDMNEAQKAAMAALAAGMADQACPPAKMTGLLSAALEAYGAPLPKKPGGEPAPDENAKQLSALVALTGKSSPDEAAGVIRAWKQGASETTALSARVESLEANHRGSEFDRVIAEGKTAGKLTPALLDAKHEVGAYIETCKPAEGKPGNVTALRAFVSALPVAAKTHEITQKRTESSTTLTAVEIEMAKKQGMDLKSLQEFKAKRAAEADENQEGV